MRRHRFVHPVVWKSQAVQWYDYGGRGQIPVSLSVPQRDGATGESVHSGIHVHRGRRPVSGEHLSSPGTPRLLQPAPRRHQRRIECGAPLLGTTPRIPKTVLLPRRPCPGYASVPPGRLGRMTIGNFAADRSAGSARPCAPLIGYRIASRAFDERGALAYALP
jgi:hypothetical protein